MTERTRRTFLGSLTATVAAGAAGCLGGDSGSDDTDTPTDSMDGGSDGTSMDDGSMDGTDTGMGGTTETDGRMGGMEGTDDGMGGMNETDDGMDGTNETDDGMGSMEETDDGMGETTQTDSGMTSTRTFEVTVTNVSEPGTLTTSDGEDLAVPLSPTAYAVHTEDVSAFTEGEAASDGLESLAEDGDPSGLGEELSGADGVAAAGTASTPDDADSAGPLTPGESYSFEVEAGHDHRLTVATMFVQSNDLFYAPDPAGMALFDGGDPVTGDVTDRLALWDAGTEANQEPGVGPDQAPRQSGPDTGPEEDGTVRPVDSVMDEFDYPATSDVVEVTVTTT